MTDSNHYFVVKEKAVSEVLLKVVEAKRLLESDKNMSVQKATETVGISRSSFYKYQDDIFPFHENAKGKTLTFIIVMMDVKGLLSKVLATVAAYEANIMTIHQTIPINGMATVTLTVEIFDGGGDTSDMLAAVEELAGIHDLKLLGRERLE